MKDEGRLVYAHQRPISRSSLVLFGRIVAPNPSSPVGLSAEAFDQLKVEINRREHEGVAKGVAWDPD